MFLFPLAFLQISTLASPLTPDFSFGVASDSLQYLSTFANSSWVVSNSQWGISVPASVPGDLVTDLQRAGVIGDPFYELGWLNTTTPGHQGAPLWDSGIWNYSLTFPLTLSYPAGTTFYLVFDGVKMAADIMLNGVYIGFVMDQFLRYTFMLPPGILLAAGNELSLAFGTSRDPRNAEGRFSGASGGWDWGPYTNTATTGTQVGGGPQFTFSKGLWRDVYIAALAPNTGAIEHLAPYVHYLGAYPVSPLTDAQSGPWRVNVRVQMRGEGSGTLTVSGAWDATGTNSTHVTLAGHGGNSTVATVSLTVPQGKVSLWWPNELGPQPLYAISASWRPDLAPTLVSSSSRNLGFRTFAIVTDDDTHPEILEGVDGSGNLTMRWKVNGADMYMRGADIIPMEVLDGRSSDLALQIMVSSAAAAHFNVLRVDGIDTYLPDTFYAACDAAGILVYQDMQYSQGNPAPTPNDLEHDELVHTVRRLAHHPSLAVYDGCNECGGHGAYASFVMSTVAQEDPSRPPWPTSPSNGWISGVDRLTSLPNGSPLGLQPTLALEVSKEGGTRMDYKLAQALRNAASLLASKDSNCTLLPNLDICPGESDCLKLPHPQVPSPQACCDACAAAGSGVCAASTFSDGVCWFKPSGRPLVHVDGTVLCWQAGQPLPPIPTPGPLPPQRSREQHGPYVHGSGFPAVNGSPNFQEIGSGPIPPQFFGTYTAGPSFPGVSISEFGCPAASSFESFSPTLAPAHWSLHGDGSRETCTGGFKHNCTSPTSGLPTNPMSQRNYPMDSIVAYYFGMGVLPSLDERGAEAFQRQLYFALLSPALQQKSHIEAFRAFPTWMTAIWQLNEIWPTNGWGSVEYGPAGGETAGQVVGGRWKPLHYWLRSHLFSTYFSACDASGTCVVRNDNPLATLQAQLTVTAISTLTGTPIANLSGPTLVSLPRGAGALAWGCMDGKLSPPLCTPPTEVLSDVGCAANGTDCAILTLLRDAASGKVLAQNLQFWTVPSSLKLSKGVTINADFGQQAPDGSVPVTLSVNGGAAVLVLLSSAAQGRWSDNALQLLAPGQHQIYFLPMLLGGGGGPPVDASLLEKSLRIEHLGMY